MLSSDWHAVDDFIREQGERRGGRKGGRGSDGEMDREKESRCSRRGYSPLEQEQPA